MRRVPDFLSPTISVWTQPETTFGAMLPGSQINGSVFSNSTIMELVVYTSPDPIHRLLMTDVIMADDRIERYFFGYKCKTCEEVYLVPDSVHSENDLLDWMRHVCDSCQITRTIRRARRMAGVEDQSTAFNPNLGRPSHYLGRPSQFFTGTRMQDPIMYDVRRSWKIVSGDDTEYEPY